MLSHMVLILAFNVTWLVTVLLEYLVLWSLFVRCDILICVPALLLYFNLFLVQYASVEEEVVDTRGG